MTINRVSDVYDDVELPYLVPGCQSGAGFIRRWTVLLLMLLHTGFDYQEVPELRLN